MTTSQIPLVRTKRIRCPHFGGIFNVCDDFACDFDGARFLNIRLPLYPDLWYNGFVMKPKEIKSKQKTVAVIPEYDRDVIFNAKDDEVVVPAKWRKPVSYVLLFVLLATVGTMVVVTIIGNNAMSTVRNPRTLLFPMGLGFAYFGVVMKSGLKAKARDTVALIVDKIHATGQSEIPIIQIAEIYLAEYEEEKDTTLDWTEKYVTDRTIDLLWDGRLSGWKYVISAKKLARMTDEERESLKPVDAGDSHDTSNPEQEIKNFD